jgi:hypothetical protein
MGTKKRCPSETQRQKTLRNGGVQMKLEETGTRSMLGMGGLRNKGMVVLSRDPKTEEFGLVAAKNIRRKWLMFNVPEKTWKGLESKEEVLTESKRLLDENILTD